MKWKIGIALLAALAIETVNFRFLAPPIDVGYEPGTPWYIQIIGLQWVLIHLAALRLMDHVERIAGCHQNNVVAGCSRVDTILFFVSGYLTTALLLIAVTVGLPRLIQLFKNASQ